MPAQGWGLRSTALQPRETATDRLADVIQVLQFGRKTGILSVERGRDGTFEEGTITFVHGQITQANVGSQQGMEALNWLSTWRQCLFTFITPPAENTAPLQDSFAPVTPATPSTNGVSNRTGAVTEPLNRNAAKSGVPRRTKSVDEALLVLGYNGLSRMHRRLLLLIDGQRSPADLVRLTGRRIEEITEQLNDLERVGVIHQ